MPSLSSQRNTHFCPKVIKIPKILRHREYHGIFYYHIGNIFRDIWKINLIGLLRYGNPEVLNLATLKNKNQIHNILSILRKNLKTDLILSRTLYFLLKYLTEIWQPWCQKIYFINIWCYKSVNKHFNFIFLLPIWFLFLHWANIRVSISEKANEIDLPHTTKIATKLLNNNAQVLSLLEDLLTLD